ncbi:MAG: MFS transporter, partial [Pyrinomonadaceae bacterium]
YVKELSRFYSYGSGSDYALGAMVVAFDNKALSAADVAKKGITAGAEFDESTAMPMQCFTVKLK